MKEIKLTKTRELIKNMCITAMCIALCVVLPMAFHSIPKGGMIFSPMHLPVFLCGLICGPFFGLLCALAGPILSMLITGMPGVSSLPGMLVELSIYSIIPYLFLKITKFKHLYPFLYIAVALGIVIGRSLGGVMSSLLYTGEGGYQFSMFVNSYIIVGWPGILIQIVVIPNLVYFLIKNRIIKIGNNEVYENINNSSKKEENNEIASEN